MARQNEPLEKIIGVLAKEKQAIQQRLLESEMSLVTRIIVPNAQGEARADSATSPHDQTL
jgi:hypothetical protein